MGNTCGYDWWWYCSSEAVDMNEDTEDGQTASGRTVLIFGAEVNLMNIILVLSMLMTIFNLLLVCSVMRQRRNQKAHGYAVAKMAESDLEMSSLEEDAFMND